MRYALVRNGVVVQIEDKAREGLVEVANSVAPGFLFDGIKFSAPPPRVLAGEELAVLIDQERDRRLALGFDHDFQNGRGVHRIGTKPGDLQGWSEVTDFANALVALGNTTTLIDVLTDTGMVQVTGLEWQAVLVSAAKFRQPIWQASFVLAGTSPIPDDITDDRHWPA